MCYKGGVCLAGEYFLCPYKRTACLIKDHTCIGEAQAIACKVEVFDDNCLNLYSRNVR